MNSSTVQGSILSSIMADSSSTVQKWIDCNRAWVLLVKRHNDITWPSLPLPGPWPMAQDLDQFYELGDPSLCCSRPKLKRHLMHSYVSITFEKVLASNFTVTTIIIIGMDQQKDGWAWIMCNLTSESFWLCVLQGAPVLCMGMASKWSSKSSLRQ